MFYKERRKYQIVDTFSVLTSRSLNLFLDIQEKTENNVDNTAKIQSKIGLKYPLEKIGTFSI